MQNHPLTPKHFCLLVLMLCNYVHTLYPSCSPLHKRELKGGAKNFGKMRKMVPLKKKSQITPYEYLSYPNVIYHGVPNMQRPHKLTQTERRT